MSSILVRILLIMVKRKIQVCQEGEGNTGQWTPREKEAFVEAIKLFGNDSRRISQYVSTRTPAQVRSHAQKYFISEAKAKKKKGSCSSEARKKITQEIATQYGEGVDFFNLCKEKDIEVIPCLTSIK
ncbi:unnamed protein product [Blepharisma stoltei]|uniref:Uncharacterized protein n=1 Tax=Blepharisma stoltei TaxID=1481888 RepID=A0AAU9IKH3_9CILI|nr:unnamed protein product [Blepharisma stoltei]